MYQGREQYTGLASSQIIILSPNKLFERYISHVLPELGEKSVQTVLFEEVFERTLNRDIQSKNRLLERLVASADPADKAIIKSALDFKMSAVFIEILNRFIYDIPRRWIPFADTEYAGCLVASRHQIREKVLRQEKLFPLGVRLKKAQMYIRKQIQKMRPQRLKNLRRYVVACGRHPFDATPYVRMLSIRESTKMILRVKEFTEIDVFGLYVRLFQDSEAFYRLAEGISLPPDMECILDYTRKNLCLKTLSYDDAVALTYLELAISGRREYPGIQQVVIDEAQDYYPMHYAILKLMFAKARYTILGDIHQSMEKEADSALYEVIPKILGKENAALITLKKSFRSTREIFDYSARFLGKDVHFESFSRSGEQPLVLGAADSDGLYEQIVEEIKCCLDSNYGSVGLLCKTERDAVDMYTYLEHRLEIRLIRPDGAGELEGVSVMPIYMAKGLEFDAVLVCRVDKGRYFTDDDRRLLYIACTRALHRLSLFYEGEISPLLTADS
jgi:DNA helicase-2/ATP-dependent DNA helicase PcrA